MTMDKPEVIVDIEAASAEDLNMTKNYPWQNSGPKEDGYRDTILPLIEQVFILCDKLGINAVFAIELDPPPNEPGEPPAEYVARVTRLAPGASRSLLRAEIALGDPQAIVIPSEAIRQQLETLRIARDMMETFGVPQNEDPL